MSDKLTMVYLIAGVWHAGFVVGVLDGKLETILLSLMALFLWPLIMVVVLWKRINK